MKSYILCPRLEQFIFTDTGFTLCSDGPAVGIVHNKRDTIDSALVQIADLKEKIRQVEQLYVS